jgi:hypothetical protein
MHIRRLIYGKYSPYIISIVLGIGLSCMFRRVCKDRNCLVYKAPALEKLENKIYKYGKNCYTFEPEAQPCDSKKKIVEFA